MKKINPFSKTTIAFHKNLPFNKLSSSKRRKWRKSLMLSPMMNFFWRIRKKKKRKIKSANEKERKLNLIQSISLSFPFLKSILLKLPIFLPSLLTLLLFPKRDRTFSNEESKSLLTSSRARRIREKSEISLIEGFIDQFIFFTFAYFYHQNHHSIHPTFIYNSYCWLSTHIPVFTALMF